MIKIRHLLNEDISEVKEFIDFVKKFDAYDSDYFFDNDDEVEDINHQIFGIRGDDILLSTSDKFYNSYKWVGDIKTDEQLDGICSVLYDRNDPIKSIRKAMSYGQHLYLICGDAIEMGMDIYNDEVVLKDHKILKVLL